uniref:Uncharacterized protein n=1 Tax=Paramormyrops kingsleyae TaxID=1676925 RepID=A0A3B3RN60_9TELE
SQGALSYRAVAQHDGGSPLFCESHDPGCMLTGLLCVPCAPQLVDAAVDCETGAVMVTWEH